MLNEQEIEQARESAISKIEEAEMMEAIQLESLHGSDECGLCLFGLDYEDGDGDTIYAQAKQIFRFDDEASVQVTLPRGFSPIDAVRVLRKMADILDGPRGHEVVNLGNAKGPDTAFFEDGELLLVNGVQAGRESFRQYGEFLRQHSNHEGAEEFSPDLSNFDCGAVKLRSSHKSLQAPPT